MLGLAIEPVAAHVVRYWEWLALGPASYYGVPLANFVAWFGGIRVVARGGYCVRQQMAVCSGNRVVGEGGGEHVTCKAVLMGMAIRVAVLTLPVLFGGSLLMFGLIDLTHGYLWAVLFARLARMCNTLLELKPSSL